MHYFLLSMSFCLASITAGAQQDSTCLRTIWYELQPNATNALFFDDSSDNNIIQTVKSLTLSNQLDIYQEQVRDLFYESDWIVIDDGNSLYRTGDSLTNIKESLFERYYTTQDYQKDEAGNPIWQILPDGTESLVYDEPIDHPLDRNILVSIRVREQLMRDQDLNKDRYVVTGFAIVVDNGYGAKEVAFWVSMLELNEVLKTKPQPAWMNALNARKFEGFQYMQAPCTN